jgi:hypothetical protein
LILVVPPVTLAIVVLGQRRVLRSGRHGRGGGAMRSNPLDNTREFDPRRLLVFAAVAMVVLFAAGWVANVVTTQRRIESVRRFVAAQGYGEAQVEPIRGDECWRAREGFRWTTATASGTACAGPGDQVALRSLDRSPALGAPVRAPVLGDGAAHRLEEGQA